MQKAIHVCLMCPQQHITQIEGSPSQALVKMVEDTHLASRKVSPQLDAALNQEDCILSHGACEAAARAAVNSMEPQPATQDSGMPPAGITSGSHLRPPMGIAAADSGMSTRALDFRQESHDACVLRIKSKLFASASTWDDVLRIMMDGVNKIKGLTDRLRSKPDESTKKDALTTSQWYSDLINNARKDVAPDLVDLDKYKAASDKLAAALGKLKQILDEHGEDARSAIDNLKTNVSDDQAMDNRRQMDELVKDMEVLSPEDPRRQELQGKIDQLRNVSANQAIDLSLETSIKARLFAMANLTPSEREQARQDNMRRLEESRKVREQEAKDQAAAEIARANKRALELQEARDRFKARVPGDLNLRDTKAAIAARLRPVTAMKPAKTPEELAKHHAVSVDEIEKRLDIGQRVEMEHTKDAEEARHIASHHIYEFLNYYTELKKMEVRLEKAAAFGDDAAEWEHFTAIAIDFVRQSPKMIQFSLQTLRGMGYNFQAATQTQYLISGTVESKAAKDTYLSEELKKAAINAEVSKIEHAIGKWARVALYEYDRPKK